MPLQRMMRSVLISFALAGLASITAVVAPAYTAVHGSAIPVNREVPSPPQDETRDRTVQHETLAGVNGIGVYFLLAIPVAVAGLPLLFRYRAVRILSAVLIAGCVVAGAASIGLFYIPSAVMMAWAAFGKSV